MKYLQHKLKQLRNYVVLVTFNRYFAKLIYSFETTDVKIAKLSEEGKRNYYQAISEWVTSEAYAIEQGGEVNELYHELAATAKDDDIMTAYRLVLLKNKNRDLRFRDKAKQFGALQAFHSTHTNLKN